MQRAGHGFGSFIPAIALAAGLLGAAAHPALAGSAWDDIRPALYGERAIETAGSAFTFTAPYRAEDQRAVPLSVEAAFTDGRKVKAVTFVVDENPMPVAAVFHLAENRDRVALRDNMRPN